MDDIKKFDVVVDSDGAHCFVTNTTPTSVEISISKKQSEGVDCLQWFTKDNFYKRFILLNAYGKEGDEG